MTEKINENSIVKYSNIVLSLPDDQRLNHNKFKVIFNFEIIF